MQYRKFNPLLAVLGLLTISGCSMVQSKQETPGCVFTKLPKCPELEKYSDTSKAGIIGTSSRNAVLYYQCAADLAVLVHEARFCESK